MIGVGLHDFAMQLVIWHWGDGQSVRQFLGFGADTGDFRDQSGQTVRLVASEMADANEFAGTIGQRRQSGDAGSNLPAADMSKFLPSPRIGPSIETFNVPFLGTGTAL